MDKNLKHAKESATSVLEKAKGVKREYYPLTPTQMGVYLSCINSPESTLYNVPLRYIFSKDSNIDLNRLIAAFKETYESHIGSNFVIEEKEGLPMMVEKRFEVEIPIEKIPADQLEEALEAFIRPFDLSSGPLYRFKVFETESEYVLLADFHHIAFDGTSVSALNREVEARYHNAEPEPEEFSVFDISVFQEMVPDTQEYENSRELYKEYFDGVEAVSNLPSDYPGSGSSGPHPNGLIVDVVPEALNGVDIEDFLSSAGLTGNTLFLGAMFYTTAKFLGQNEAIIYSVNHGRSDKRMVNTVAMMVTPLPIHMEINEGELIKDFLERVQERQHRTQRNSLYPFQSLVHDYGFDPAIQFVFQKNISPDLMLEGERLRTVHTPAKHSMNPLSLSVSKVDGGYQLDFEYQEDLYDAETIQSFAKLYKQVLGEMLERERLEDIVLADAEETERVLDISRAEEIPVDLGSLFLDHFAQAREAFPNNTALVYNGKSYSYEALDELSDRLAAKLVEMGVGKGDIVGVLIERSEFMVILPLAVLKAGAAYLPLDLKSPQDRLEYMLKDSATPLVLADRELLGKIPNFTGAVLTTDEVLELEDMEAELPSIGPEDLFIVIYTSGSTGTPKGVKINHRNIANLVNWSSRVDELSPESRYALHSNFSFDPHLMGTYPVLAKGGAVHVIPEERRLDLVWFNEYCLDKGITNTDLTTQIARAYMTAVDDIAPIRITTGGEKLPAVTPREGATLLNQYGPTECTVVTTNYEVEEYAESAPIGKPVGNAHLYVIDAQRRLLPRGAIGELAVAGPSVSDGYLNLPEKTAEVFLPNPFESGEDYQTLYRTGDLVRFNKDGDLEIFGRQDEMVKIRGYRIELSEVNSAVASYGPIKDSYVASFPQEGGGEYLAAYIVSDEEVDIAALRDHIASLKPEYMVPEAFVQLDEIPLTPNGKVNKKLLPEPERGAAAKGAAPAATRTPNELEERILDILETVIDTRDVPMEEDLKFYGLNSISIVSLAAKLNKELGVSVDIRPLLSNASVLSIENMIIQGLLANREAAAPVRQEASRQPLSSPQFGIYSENMRNPESSFYNIPFYFVLPDATDLEKLKEAVAATVNAHSSLKINLSLEEDGIMQSLVDREVEVPTLTMSEEEFERHKTEFNRPFRLLDSPLYRAEIVETPEHRYLLLNFHHIVFDGFSSDLFTRDLERAYRGEALKPESHDYFSYISQESSDKERYEESKAFYTQMLKDSEGSSSLPATGNGPSESILISLPFDLKAVEAFCRERGITPAQLFLASTLYVTARYTNSAGAYINTISNGRTNLDYQDTFGMFVKTLPIGLNLPDGDVESFILECAKLLTDTIQNDSYPYYEIARAFNYSQNILYAYQLGIGEPTIIEGEKLERRQLAPREAKFDVGVYIEKADGQDSISVLYDGGKYGREDMERFLKSIKTVTDDFINHPNRKLREVSTLDKEGLALLESLSQTDAKELKANALHELLERQARLNPEKTALVTQDARLSYRELNETANRIANELIRLGVKNGDRIALLLDRDASFIASLYGVLKAGAAFIPITKQYPKERIERILSDSSSRFIIIADKEQSSYDNSLSVLELERGANAENPGINVSPEDLAYLIYTSGSTGQPKGVMLSHGGIVNYVANDQANRHVQAVAEEGNAYGSITSVSFDMSLKETVLSLSNGLTLVFASEEQINDPAELARFFLDNGVDVFNATPSRMQIYMEDPAFLEFLRQCKVIIAGAEKYPDTLLKELKKTKAKLFNTYGPTEATVSANAKELTNAERVTVGKPLLNVKEYIVDLDLNPVPVGVTGELLIGGKGVALGYNNLEEETRKAFIDFKGERFYRTGDLARWNEDGEVEILGRNDSQVKIRGLRIELGEVEKAAAETGMVDSVYAAVKETNGNDALCLYYTAKNEFEPSALKEALRKSLPDYMIPSHFMKLESIPVTINGKIDLKMLPTPKEERTSKTEDSEAASYIEQEIIDIFKKVLETDDVPRSGNFFELGGSSLTVTRVIIEARKRNLNIAYGDLFDHPTPEALAKQISDQGLLDSNLDDYRNYDYSRINAVLEENTLENFLQGERQALGDVILTGATGFLGIHILHELLESTDSHVYLFQRGKNGLSPEHRVEGLYYYYFGQKLLDLYSDRVTVIEGDITDKESFKRLEQIEADTFINCAANVKHYAKGSEIENVDYYGVANIVEYCKNSDVKLVQVSTMSIGGIFLDQPGEVSELRENQLFYGQLQNSKYTSSKFLAERMILEEVANGLNAKIMRVGNLSPRESDGEFQINFTTNTFMGRLRAISKLGHYPYEFMDNKFEFSPIDDVAKAILKLAETPKENTVLHPFNNHSMLMHDLYDQLEYVDTPVKGVENEEFQQILKQAQENPETAELLSSFIAYDNSAHGRKIYPVAKSNEMTMQILYRLGFTWPVVSIEYMRKFLHTLKEFLFFDYLF